MFFSIPATGKARDKKPKEEPKKEVPKEEAPAAQSIPPPPPGPPPPLPPPPAPEEDTPKVDAHAAAAALYPSMRPDYDPAERAADEAPRKRTVVVEDAARPTSVFLSGLPLTVKDSELQQFLRGCGVLQSIKKVRDRGVFNGCAIVTFGGTDAVERALERSGRALGGKAVTVARSLRTGKQAEHDDDGGGAVFDQLNNRLYPHDVPEAHLDFKKRRIMYPKDHDR